MGDAILVPMCARSRETKKCYFFSAPAVTKNLFWLSICHHFYCYSNCDVLQFCQISHIACVTHAIGSHSHTHETGLFSHIFVHAWGPVMNSIFTNRDCRIEMPYALGHFVVQQLLIYRSQGTLLLFRYTRY